MSSKNRILALDVGASKIMLAEFALGGSAPMLTGYAVKSLESLSHEAGIRSLFSVAGDVRDLMADNGIKPAPMYVSLSGQAVFPRFVKLPPVSEDKVDEMLLYEVRENLPFPVEEVVWDYQVTSDDPTEVDTLIVATKRDSANDAVLLSQHAGVRLEVIDAIPFALYNCVRFNCPEDGGCTMVLDIGARSTNLVFIEGAKVFSRSISVAGNTITTEISRGLGVSLEEAERIKKEIGVVALGGTYAVMGDEMADKVSKIIRNVVTRLHSEVNRSINFYRGPQGGSMPTKLYLTGGTALTHHMDTFFREKLEIEVEYLNPFANVPVAPGLEGNSEDLYLMSAAVGLALRAGVKCPIEINLIPPEMVETRRFARRVPFFGVAVAGLVLTILCWFYYSKAQQELFTNQSVEIQGRIKNLSALQSRISTLHDETKVLADKNAYMGQMVASRASYAEIINAVRAAMIPGTWMTAMSFESQQDQDQVRGDVYMNIVVRGFRRELDNLVRDAGGVGSASEMLLANIVKNSEFFGSQEEGSKVVAHRSVENDKLSELSLSVKLNKKPGVFDPQWLSRWEATEE